MSTTAIITSATLVIVIILIALDIIRPWEWFKKKPARKTYTAGLVFGEEGNGPCKVALVRKAKPAWQRGKLNLIGGKIEPGESPLGCNAREFCEETGKITCPTDWEQFCELSSDDFIRNDHEKFTVHFFVYRYLDIDLELLKGVEDEPIEVIDLCDIYPGRGDMLNNVPWLIGMALERIGSAPRLSAKVTE